MGSAQGLAVASAKSHTSVHVYASTVRAEHIENYDRAALYTTSEVFAEFNDADGDNPIEAIIGAKCCYTLAEVEARLESFKTTSPRGQISEVVIYKTNTGYPVLVSGYLRHLAMLVAELRDCLGDIPAGAKGLRCLMVPAPKTHEDREALAWANHTENAASKLTTPLDLAWFIKRQLDQPNTSIKSLAERLKISVSHIRKHVRLLGYKFSVQLDVHEGRMTLAAANAQASKDGEGTHRGPLTGVKRSTIQRAYAALTEQDYCVGLLASETTYTSQDMLNLAAWIGGVKNGDVPKAFQDFFTDPPKAEPKQRGRKKKAPPGPGAIGDANV